MLHTGTLQITNPMLKIIAEIDEFRGTWLVLGRLAPERLQMLRRVAAIESIGSSTRIEGGALSDREIEALLSNISIGSFATRDEQEVAGYAAVMETVFDAFGLMPLTENIIKQLHRDLLVHSEKDARHRGAYKTNPNSVEAFDADGRSVGVIFETASPFDTPRLMEELVGWVNSETDRKDLHPLFVVAVFIVVFLEIHPFQDGNGRLSRVLTTLLLLRAGYDYVPYSSMENVIEQSKDSYYLALRRTQGTIRTSSPDWEPWVMFFLRSLQRQKERLEKKIEREQLTIARLPELSVQILEFVRDHGRATVSDLVRTTGRNRSTVKTHLRKLVEARHLTLHGAGRGAWYGMA